MASPVLSNARTPHAATSKGGRRPDRGQRDLRAPVPGVGRDRPGADPSAFHRVCVRLHPARWLRAGPDRSGRPIRRRAGRAHPGGPLRRGAHPGFSRSVGRDLCCGEQGLLGLAFAPDYAASGRFYVNFTNPDGNTVVARFLRSGNPLVADPARVSICAGAERRHRLHRPAVRESQRRQPGVRSGRLSLHRSGRRRLGRRSRAIARRIRRRCSARCCASTSTCPTAIRSGLRVPAEQSVRRPRPARCPRSGSFGLRNPWRYSFDDPARGGTGALVIADVGQGCVGRGRLRAAGRGGRNYGWRNREGAHDIRPRVPPAFLPLVDPIYEYDHTAGQSITGGYVYRGAALGATFRGPVLLRGLRPGACGRWR